MKKKIFIDGLAPKQDRDKKNNRPVDRYFSATRKISQKMPDLAKKVRTTIKPKTVQISQSTNSYSSQNPKYRPRISPIVEKKDSQSSYARDVLGIQPEEDEIEFNFHSEDFNMKKKKKNKIKKRKIWILVGSIIFIIFLIIYLWGNNILLKITGGKSGIIDFLRSSVSEKTDLKTAEDGRTNILVFGTSGYDMQGSEAEDTHDGYQLTDSIMVLSLNKKQKSVSMISIPRDVKTDTCMPTSKINELYYCGNPKDDNEKAGAEMLKNRVEEILNLKIQYYAHVNWSSLTKIVDTIGGINVTLDEDINDVNYTKLVIKSGVATELNGENALKLARARYGTVGGDFTRANSQQKIIMAIKDKILQKKLNLNEIINLANIFGDNLRTDFSANDITALAKFMTDKDLAFHQIPLVGASNSYMSAGRINGISYVFPTSGVGNYELLREYVKNKLGTTPSKNENAKILVLNGSGVDGLAKKEQEELEKNKFIVKDIGNAPSGNYFKKLYLYNLTNKKETLSQLEKFYNTKADNKENLPEGINIDGVDFVLILGIGYRE